ncbi:MAG: Sensor protein, partial [uncultured bacterium]
MNGIVGFTNLLKKSGLNGTQKEFVDIIKSSCDHLLGLIDDLLDFSNIEAGKIKLDMVIFNIRCAIADSISFVSEHR